MATAKVATSGGTLAAPAVASRGTRVDLVALGNPHLSIDECALLAALVSQNTAGGGGDSSSCGAEQGLMSKRPAVRVVATLGRAVHSEAQRRGHVAVLERWGVEFVTDTCWCMLGEPVVPPRARALATNSAKYAHYAPGLLPGLQGVRFLGLTGCIEAARTGFAPPPPAWVASALPES